MKLLPTPRASDGEHGGPNQRGSRGDLTVASAVNLLPTPTARDGKDLEIGPAKHRPDDVDTLSRALVDFGHYAPAVRRWERVLGRSAPSPTQPSKNGKPQLSPTFVEWMMGLPTGWVTDVGLPRTQQLRALGNGVVPQQAAEAIRFMVSRAHTLEEE